MTECSKIMRSASDPQKALKVLGSNPFLDRKFVTPTAWWPGFCCGWFVKWKDSISLNTLPTSLPHVKETSMRKSPELAAFVLRLRPSINLTVDGFYVEKQKSIKNKCVYLFVHSTKEHSCFLLLKSVRMRQVGEMELKWRQMSLLMRTASTNRSDLWWQTNCTQRASTHTKSTIYNSKSSEFSLHRILCFRLVLRQML